MAANSQASTDYEGKDHQFQVLGKPGPRGAYESRQVDGGFYVRVDMPGVPPKGVKLFKRGETHTVTFTGKALKRWPHCELSDRVYGGYVVLDRNPDEIDVEMTVINGSLRLFFPAADGLLHSVSKQPFPPQPLGFPNLHLRQKGDFSSDEDQKNVEFSDLDKITFFHNNPFLLDGSAGVVEGQSIVDVYGGTLIYSRVDMPGLGEKKNNVRLVNDTKFIFGGEGSQDHRFDEGGRSYAWWLMNECTCCQMFDVHHEMKHGVFRLSFQRRTLPRSSDKCKLRLIIAYPKKLR